MLELADVGVIDVVIFLGSAAQILTKHAREDVSHIPEQVTNQLATYIGVPIQTILQMRNKRLFTRTGLIGCTTLTTQFLYVCTLYCDTDSIESALELKHY